MASAAASCSSKSTRKKYDVFISFHGADTRYTFVCHLYDRFHHKKIKAYIDEVGLNKGDEISSALLEGIEESEISLIILSENYASSRWCLDELNHVLLCKEKNNQIVVPVFYRVDPENVRKQLRSYALAIAAHEERFKDQMEKVQKWKNSLTTVANLAGFHSSKFGPDSNLLEAILQDVMMKLNPRLPYHHYYSKDLVGINRRMEHIETMMDINSSDVRIIAIWGMGGIGKTTLARVVFNWFAASNHFEGFHFLENLKEVKKNKWTKLQKTLFSELLKENNLNFVNQFPERLRHTKVLIVLDDIDDKEQLEYLAGDRDWFGAGSRIIVTTRDMEVFNSIQADVITYEVEELDPNEALELFCLRAFQRDSPATNYEDLSKKVVNYAKGIPLALKVLGSHLYRKSTKEWESALDKLGKDPNKKINEVLKLSYDGLEKNEQQIFLDIACFFNGQPERSFRTILKEVFGRYVDIGIRILEDRSLITRTDDNTIQMHDLLQQMGQSIVHDESNDPGKRSRLWLIEDIRSVLEKNKGTGAIQGISLEMHEPGNAIELEPHVFNEMHNLQYLNVRDRSYFYTNNCLFKFPRGLDSLPDELRYICWDNYPLTYLPRRFNPQNIVELNFSRSKLEHLWIGVQNFANLKSLCLRGSCNLIQLPDLSQAVKLEKIDLIACESLENLPSSIGSLTLLQTLELPFCSNFREFPSSIGRLTSLQTLDLSYCSNFSKFPESLPANIQELWMNGTAIEEVPQSIESLSHLQELHLRNCKQLKSLPDTICKLRSLECLYLENCSELEYLPEISEPMEHLRQVELQGTGIRELPSSINNLCKYFLRVTGCKNLQSVPQIISNMDLGFLNLSGCSKFENLQPWKSMNLDSFHSLSLDNTSVSEIPDFFFHSKSLRELSLRGTKIRAIPASIKHSKLQELNVSDCNSLQFLSEPPVSIKKVYAMRCTSLQMVSHTSIESVSDTWIAFKEEILERCRYSQVQFVFDDCLKLDHNNVTTEFQVRALRLGTAFLERSKEIQEDKGFDCQVVSSFSGDDEIPKWFNYQNDDGCLINMKLSPYCYDATNFMGIASCIVVERESEFNGKENGFDLRCIVNVKTNDGERSFYFPSYKPYKPYKPYKKSPFEYTFASNRMIMWYFHNERMNLSSVEEMSVEFSMRFASTYKLKRCGIRMLQLQDAVEFGIGREFVRKKKKEMKKKKKKKKKGANVHQLIN